MSAISLKSCMLSFYRSHPGEWVNKGKIEQMAMDGAWNNKRYLGDNASRRLRELENEGRIQRKLIGKIVWYRLTQAEPTFDPNKFLESLVKEDKKQGVLL